MRSLIRGRKSLLAGLALLAVACAGGAAATALTAQRHATSPGASAAVDDALASLDASTGAASGRHSLRGHGVRRHLGGVLVRATAKETGLTRDTIVSRLRAGETLDTIAGSKAGAVETDALTAIRTWLDRAVKRGFISKNRESDMLARAKTRIEKVMSTTFDAGSPRSRSRASSPASSA